MARYIGPKHRLQRRIGENLDLKTNAAKVMKRLNVRPGQHGHSLRVKLSEYGRQLREKQKLKYMYGILEKQMKRLFEEASKDKTSTGVVLLTLLERRLDNVVYRLGFAPTRAAARQLVSHNHILVNDKKMNIPSYQVRIGDIITLKEKARKIPTVKESLNREGYVVPDWLERKGYSGTVVKYPDRSHISSSINEQLVVEFYNR